MNQIESDSVVELESDLERKIWETAEYQKDEDYYLLYSLLRTRQVFMPVDASSLPPDFESGQSICVGDTDNIRVYHVSVGDIPEPFIPAATKVNNKLLNEAFVEIAWIDILRMVERISNVGGVLLQGDESWVAFDRERISYILHWYEQTQSHGPGFPFIPILIVSIALLTYLFGWVVLGIAVGLAIALTLGTVIYDGMIRK